MFWDAEQLDRHPSRSVETGIASEPLCPRSAESAHALPGKGAVLATWAIYSENGVFEQ